MKVIVNKKTYDFTKLTALLEKYPLKNNRRISGFGKSQAFGKIYRHWRGVGVCSNTAKYPEIWDELQAIQKKYFPSFEYDGIQINHNYQSIPHKDKNNTGLSLIISWGDYSGGELCLDTGEIVDTRSPFYFNGNANVHWNNPIKGTKYSIIFFRVRH